MFRAGLLTRGDPWDQHANALNGQKLKYSLTSKSWEFGRAIWELWNFGPLQPAHDHLVLMLQVNSQGRVFFMEGSQNRILGPCTWNSYTISSLFFPIFGVLSTDSQKHWAMYFCLAMLQFHGHTNLRRGVQMSEWACRGCSHVSRMIAILAAGTEERRWSVIEIGVTTTRTGTVPLWINTTHLPSIFVWSPPTPKDWT